MPGPSASTPAHEGQMQTVDQALAGIASRQHGIVARAQVEGLGIAGNTVDRSARTGRLHRVHRAVYAVGHPAITLRGRWLAAVLASGDGAVLSHRSATALWGVWGSGTGEIHVTVPPKTRPQGSIRRHYSMLPQDEATVHEGIPVTSVARAVLDLAGERGQAAAEAALREAEYLRLYGPASVPVLLERHPNHRGTRHVRTCLERLKEDPGGRLRSPLEELFLPFLDAHRIPRPRLNAWLTVDDHRHQVDCLWPEAGLVAELDGWGSHGTRRAFRKDRRRDRRLGAHGFQIVRITEDQVTDEPFDLAADLRSLLEHPAYNRP
ncbi:MAG: DUF559 domain-containing protein [Actinobacteria bacterium]|nr:DUF559 domain-containing protein [Actinomycetota bacterium]